MNRPFSNIVVDPAKIRDYCLNEQHPRGRHKARAFRSRLGLTTTDSEWLRQTLMDVARSRQDEFRESECDAYGDRYLLDFELTTAAGTAMIRSAWIVLAGEDVLRLTTCYVL